MTVRANPRDNWRPAHDELLLLRAAIAPGPESKEAWRAWCSLHTLDEIGGSAYYLLPTIYHRLAGAESAASELTRLKGVARKTWYDNQLLQQQYIQAAALLAAAGIVPLVMRGLAISADRPGRLALRSMDDASLIVSPACAVSAWRTLQADGWRPANGDAVHSDSLAYRGQLSLQRNEGRRLTLAWRILPGGIGPESEAELWALSQPLGSGWLQARALDLVCGFILACVEGVTWRPLRDWRWALDAVAMLEAGLDWDNALRTAGRLHLSVAMSTALDFLALELGAPVPHEVRAQLNRPVAAPSEARAYSLASRRPTIAARWQVYRRLAAAGRQPATSTGFLRHLQTIWALSSLWQMPAFVARRGWNRLRELYLSTVSVEPKPRP